MIETIHLIGSGGFIGSAIKRLNIDNNLVFWSSNKANYNDYYFDLYERNSWVDMIKNKPKIVILLSWPGLPNYNSDHHLTKNLPNSIALLDNLIKAGIEKIVIAGTCYEYGCVDGSIKEKFPTNPQNLYSIAKDTLRRYSEIKCGINNVNFSWLRIFYVYGQGQNEKSLYPSLRRAIFSKSKVFKLTSGNQLRDFVPVDEIAKQLIALATNSKASGIYNGGSGYPTSIKDFAEKVVFQSNSKIKLEFGKVPDRKDESQGFWADMTKFSNLK